MKVRECDHTSPRSPKERSKRHLFLEVQDGVLASAGKILNRMIELKGLSDDVMKNSSDSANYNREFQDLQQQIYDMASLKFNGVSMFAQFSSKQTMPRVFSMIRGSRQYGERIRGSDGSVGAKVSVNKVFASFRFDDQCVHFKPQSSFPCGATRNGVSPSRSR